MKARDYALGAGAGICGAVAAVPVEGMPPWAQTTALVLGFVCALFFGVSREDARRSAVDRASETAGRTHPLLLVLLAIGLSACAGTQDTPVVEVVGVEYQASCDARLIPAFLVGGIPVVPDIACRVAVEGGPPACAVCLDVAGASRCWCYSGLDPFDCAEFPRAEVSQ